MRYLALVLFLVALVGVRPVAAEPIQGSGSTFVYPLIQRISQEYQVFLSGDGDFTSDDNALSYEPVGSLGGILRLQRPEIDFAASDYPLSTAELDKAGYVQFPIVAGAIAAIVNLPDIEGQSLKLSAATLAGIYLGNIQNWNDPVIAADNPGIMLPDLRITVVTRADGSGSTFNWTSYLSMGSAVWKEKYGAAILVSWPLGQAVKGSGAMAATVAATKGAIGYLEFGQAQRAGLQAAALEAAHGNFVAPSRASIQSAVAAAPWAADANFDQPLLATASNSADAYPLVTATYIVMRRENGFLSGYKRAMRFFKYGFDHGDKTSLDLGYVPLPENAKGLVRAYWVEKLNFGS